MITVHKLVPKHSKDGQVMVIKELFLTTSHELYLSGVCSACGQQVSFTVPLQDLIDQCPEPEFTIKDMSDLASMGISLQA